MPCEKYSFRDPLGHPLENCIDYKELLADANRWRFFAASAQSALVLGSPLDPNSSVDFKKECDRLIDAMMEG